MRQELDCQYDLRHSQSAQPTGAAALNASHLRDEALQEWLDATGVNSAEDACTMAPTVGRARIACHETGLQLAAM